MSIFSDLSQHGVVPVIALDDASRAVPLADALIEGGLPVAEITFRTDAAAAAIEAIAKARPEILLGAGTVLTGDQLDRARDAGARFALAPGLDRALLDHATAAGIPFAPGVMTPSDLQAAIRAGCDFVKFFPAMPAGGPSMLKNIAAPYAHLGIGFNPTGGVTPGNLADWLALPQVRAVGGTWIASRDAIAARDWRGIAGKAREAVARVAELRGQG